MRKRLLIPLILLTAGTGIVTSVASPAPTPSEPTDPHPSVAKSDRWQVQVSSLTGGVVQIADPTDLNGMNWVQAKRPWGIMRVALPGEKSPVAFVNPKSTGDDSLDGVTLRLKSVYESSGLGLEVLRTLDKAGTLTEAYTLTNEGNKELHLPEGACSITVPFNDSYEDGAPKCLTNNCNAHLWAGGHSSWANAIRMDGGGNELGLVLTQGSLATYSILDGADTNHRGDLAFNLSDITLQPGASTTVQWTLFWHKNWADFWPFLCRQSGFVRMNADHYSVITGQPIEMTAESDSSLERSALTYNGKPVPTRIQQNVLYASVQADHAGEYRFELSVGGRTMWLRAWATPEPMDLIKARVNFIVEKQQMVAKAADDPLDGAYLPYDNQTGVMFSNQSVANNRNEGRERMGMGVLAALYIPHCTDPGLKKELLASLDRYESFLQRELMDDQGLVYSQAGRKDSRRLYNYPWMAHVHLAAYEATHDKRYLDLYMKVMRGFYNIKGGAGFYAIGLPMLDSLKAFQEAGMTAEHDELLRYYTHHADSIVKRGKNYPKSEVNYEQSIVGPSVQIELEMYLATKNPVYLSCAKELMVYLEAFNGKQPDYHLNDIGIRHWDDYWFGKLGLNGDTMPHYWSTITGVAFAEYAQATNDPDYSARANDIFMNNLCLFTADGHGSCAFVYPATLNGHPGNQLDPYANDQDWALVNWLTVHNRVEAVQR